MSYIIKGNKHNWELVIGLEVHSQIISNAKLFSGASSAFGGDPNSHVSFIDAGYPGVLPRVNEFCIEQALKTGLALNGKINNISYFDRKHYFYPDLPLGYQITQFYVPIMENGNLVINLDNNVTKSIGIERLHIEQDAGKLLHDHHSTKSLVDLNRAGVGLMEIVSRPDLSSPTEVAAYITKIRSILRYIETCDGNMEEGSLRCDINISVRPEDETQKRTRVEVKNVNSIRFVMQAIEYEALRQVKIWEEGGTVKQETRLFDSNKVLTLPLRSKEEATDYRYFRDPDLLAIQLADDYIAKVKDSLPELPDAKMERFLRDYNLSSYEAEVLVREKEVALYFEEALTDSKSPLNDSKQLANWIITNLFSYLNKESLDISNSKIIPSSLANLMYLIEQNVISSKIAKEVFDIMLANPNKLAEDIVKEKGLQQITNEAEIETIVDEIINDNANKVAEVKAGKEKLLGWFVGEAMKKTKGKANPELLNKILKKKIYL